MFSVIGDKISVAGVYHQSNFSPKYFVWQDRKYDIQEVTLISDVKDGAVKKRLYSVLVAGNLYRLEFNREAESWQLAEVWTE